MDSCCVLWEVVRQKHQDGAVVVRYEAAQNDFREMQTFLWNVSCNDPVRPLCLVSWSVALWQSHRGPYSDSEICIFGHHL